MLDIKTMRLVIWWGINDATTGFVGIKEGATTVQAIFIESS
jgi:hypothetical protein